MLEKAVQSGDIDVEEGGRVGDGRVGGSREGGGVRINGLESKKNLELEPLVSSSSSDGSSDGGSSSDSDSGTVLEAPTQKVVKDITASSSDVFGSVSGVSSSTTTTTSTATTTATTTDPATTTDIDNTEEPVNATELLTSNRGFLMKRIEMMEEARLKDVSNVDSRVDDVRDEIKKRSSGN